MEREEPTVSLEKIDKVLPILLVLLNERELPMLNQSNTLKFEERRVIPKILIVEPSLM
jgi:hypothetical protein